MALFCFQQPPLHVFAFQRLEHGVGGTAHDVLGLVAEPKMDSGKNELVNLSSFNAKPINGVKLDWIGEICVTLPRGQIARLRAKAAARSRKAKSSR